MWLGCYLFYSGEEGHRASDCTTKEDGGARGGRGGARGGRGGRGGASGSD